jgi:3-hydroxyacyl-CoA dehydrogenase / enoyl-CoA hydratase / 3-hydroxybutyryl-CoA epimerase
MTDVRVQTASTRASNSAPVTMEVEDGIAVLTMDLVGEPVNKVTRAVRDAMMELFDRIDRDDAIKGAVLMSGKDDNFLAGADVEEFTRLRDAEDAERLSRDGQALVEHFEKARVPFVAAIHGACLGAGLESALACRWRIATDHPKTILALPEVQLGLIPGAGGTQRLPRLIGARAALDMILTSKNVRAKKALQIGLIDEMVHPAILRRIAVDRARALGEGRLKRTSHSNGAMGLLLDSNRVGRGIVFKKAREETTRKTHGNFPAPLAAIDAVEAGLTQGMPAGLREEARLFGEMAATDVSKQLIFLFFATTALKKDSGLPPGHAATPLRVEKLGIVGSGFMGAGIAAVAVQQGTIVRMKDADWAHIGKGLGAVSAVVKERLARRQITRVEYADTMSLVSGTTDYTGFANADLIIEAVFEDLEVKQSVLREVEAVVKPQAIFATNTSTIPIARVAEVSRRPERVLGMHFFSPVNRMPLLEVVVTPRTADSVTATAVAYGKKLGKTVIVVNDAPGFFVNRILAPYMSEAGRLLDEGTAIEAIDQALVDFGFPVGPITLLDEVGLDIAGKVGKIMSDAFGSRLAQPDSLRSVVDAGRFGRKSKKGFYEYDVAGKKGGVDNSVYEIFAPGRARIEVPESDIQKRTVYAMLNEAARCLEEGIIRSPRDGDVGAVFGIGFPPFRGGPFRYMDTLGLESLLQQLDDLNVRFPGRFEAAPILLQMARSGARFYPVPLH